MNVRELNRNQLNELKEHYLTQKLYYENKDVSYGELLESHNILDSVIFDEYDGINFSNDDFTCTCGMENILEN